MESLSIGKYRKTKAYGLVGCLSFMMFGSMLAISPIPGVGLETVHASVVGGGSDIKDTDVSSSDNSGVAMTYTTFESGTSGKQTASGSGVFVAPNVVVTVAHNYLDKNKETNEGFVRGGDSAQSYVVTNSSTEKVNKNPSTGESQLVNKGDIHYYNDKELGSSYTNDLAVTVLDKPVEAMTDGKDSYRNIGTAEKGDDIRLVGYPNDFSSKNISDTNRERLKDGKLYEVRGILSELNTSTGEGTYHMSALGGFSGGPIFNDKGDVVGIHQHGTNSDATLEAEQHGGGLFFTNKHKAWIQSMIDKYAIKGWYVDGDNKYYYDENHQAVKNIDKEIDGARYHFDEKGHAKLISGIEKGQLVLKAFDKKGEKLFERVISKGNVGEAAFYNFKLDKENQTFFSKNTNATVVSIDGEIINKKFNESWSKTYESKYKLGDTVIKAVIDGATDFNRTEPGKVDTSGKVNFPKLTDEIRREPNGETNFGATGRIVTPDGTGSGTLISEDTILTVAHNFLKFANGKVVENSNGSGDRYIFTLTNGKTVRFSDADIHYWKRDDAVIGFTHDLAVIKLKNKIEDVKPANLALSTPRAQNGDKVSVFGFPDGKFGTVLNTPVLEIVDRQNGLTGLSYNGTKPGASGGGLYNANGDIIGVHQNGVVNSRSGGLVFSKEQLDWVKSYVDNQPKDPVYRKDGEKVDEKDSNKFNLKNSEETNILHDWIKDKITKLDFSKNTKDEVYGLVSEDGKTYGDVRKIVSDWKAAKLPQGNYSIKKLKIIDISDNDRKSHFTVREEPTGINDGINGDLGLESIPSDLRVERVIDSETNKNLDLMLYSNKSIDETDTPGYYDVKTFFTISENNYNITREHNTDFGSRYMGFWSMPYGDREITFTYTRDQEFIIGTKPKIEFTNDKVKVRERRVELKNLDVDEHTTTQNYDVIEHNYELDKEPRKIVKETPGMKIDVDPGTIKATADGYEANSEIKKLQNLKTGYVFKVKSYEADGTTSYRYFRTWTLPVGTSYGTSIPYSDDENYTNLLKSKISYTPDNELDYGKIKVGESFATEASNNVSLITWSQDEPKSPDDTNFVQTNTPILDGTENNAITRIEYPETVKVNSKIFDLNYIIGIKPRTTKVFIENRPVKYLGNENLDVNEKVVKEGKDKFKVTTTNYTLVKTEGEKQDVISIFDNHTDEIKEINETDKNVPNIENKGVSKEDVITYENSEEKVIEKKINKPKIEKIIIPKSIKYIKDDTRDKGLPNEEVEGRDGSKSITITETVNEHTGEIIENRGEPVIVNPTETVIKVAAKDKVETKEIPSPKRYEADVNKDYGSQNDEIKGKVGSDVTTTVYTVNPSDGTITEKLTTKHTDPIPTIVKIGTKPKVVTKVDDKGRKVTETTTYTVDPDTGKVTSSTTTSYGDKASTVEKKVVPSPKRYEKDSSREKGSENIVVKGKDGEDQITTSYVVDPKTGNVTPSVGKPVRTVNPTETVIKVAAKDKVETIRKNGDTIERTTRYTVNPENGEITEETIDKLISSNGNGVIPPVVENNDFNGGVNGDLDGNSLLNEKPEYTGVIAGNGLDDNGNIIEPPVLKIPEFNGDLSTRKTSYVGTGLNDFVPKKEIKEDNVQFIPVNEEKQFNDDGFKRFEKPKDEKQIATLPNTAGQHNIAINVLGALTITSVLSLVATKRKKED